MVSHKNGFQGLFLIWSIDIQLAGWSAVKADGSQAVPKFERPNKQFQNWKSNVKMAPHISNYLKINENETCASMRFPTHEKAV